MAVIIETAEIFITAVLRISVKRAEISKKAEIRKNILIPTLKRMRFRKLAEIGNLIRFRRSQPFLQKTDEIAKTADFCREKLQKSIRTCPPHTYTHNKRINQPKERIQPQSSTNPPTPRAQILMLTITYCDFSQLIRFPSTSNEPASPGNDVQSFR